MNIERIKRLSFNELELCVNDVVDRINEDCVSPDVLVGIKRGGLTVSRLFADKLEMSDVYTIACKNYSDVGERLKEPIITEGIGEDVVKDKVVLLVDDTADSGKSLQKCFNYMYSLGPAYVICATIYRKEKSIITPHYNTRIQDENVWVSFPGEDDETKRGLFLRGYKNLLLESGFTEEDIKDAMIRHYKKGFTDIYSGKAFGSKRLLAYENR